MRIFAVAILALLGLTPVASARRVAAVPAVSSSGCGTSRPTGSRQLTVRSGGRTRVVIIHTPRGYVATHTTPLVVNLHGSESTAAAQEAFTGMDSTADADDFLVAYPQAALAAGSGFDWNIPGQPLVGGTAVPRGAPNDVSFLAQVVATIRQQYCVDPARVYATGFSGGARMASQLACAKPSTFAAVAPVSGLRYPAPCQSSRATPIVAFHGTADPVDPYSGNGQQYWTYSVSEAARRWAVHDGCASTPTLSAPASGTSLMSYPACADASAVQLYTLAGEGHEWPGGPTMPKRITRVLGAQSDAIDANTVMWSFFVAHPLIRTG